MNNSAFRAEFWKVLFWPLLWLEAVIVTYLNWDATAMTGLIPYYEEYARIVSSGFKSSGSAVLPTFPMWGYGWVMLLLRTKLAIVVFQQALAMIAVWAMLRIVSAGGLLTKRSKTTLKAVLLLSPGWFALHSVLWPNSVFASLLPLSLLVLVHGFHGERRPAHFALSGILFGVLLNFRSDFLLLPVALAILLVTFDGTSGGMIRRACIWLAAVYVMIIPWAAYTRAATGQVLLTSTNGGHVFFIGLGNLPGNKWRIQADDGDSVMHRVLKEKFGKPVPASVTFKADGFLKRQFVERIKEEPAEYLRKMAYTGRSIVVKGAYSGEVYEMKECRPDCWRRLDNRGLRVIADLPQLASVSPGLAIRTVAYLGSEAITRFFVLLSYLVFPFTVLVAVRRRNLLAGVVVLTIGYQSLLSMAGYYMPAYTSMLFLILALNLAIGGAWLVDRAGRVERPAHPRKPDSGVPVRSAQVNDPSSGQSST